MQHLDADKYLIKEKEKKYINPNCKKKKKINLFRF